MWLQRPTRETAVVHVLGELDSLNVARLQELLMPRLASTLRTLVVDLSHVTFLGVDALRVLNTAHHRAKAHGKSLRLVTGPAAVDRALLAAGLADVVETRHDQRSALGDEHDPTEPRAQ